MILALDRVNTPIGAVKLPAGEDQNEWFAANSKSMEASVIVYGLFCFFECLFPFYHLPR